MVRLECAHGQSPQDSGMAPVCAFAEARVAHAFLQNSDKPARRNQWWREDKHHPVVEQQRVGVI